MLTNALDVAMQGELDGACEGCATGSVEVLGGAAGGGSIVGGGAEVYSGSDGGGSGGGLVDLSALAVAGEIITDGSSETELKKAGLK